MADPAGHEGSDGREPTAGAPPGPTPAEPEAAPGCELCEAARYTHWYHEDDVCWVADCEVCETPMVVWKLTPEWSVTQFNLQMNTAVSDVSAWLGAIDRVRDIIIPILRPITISIMIILGHVSLKIFDLIFAMSGKGPGFATDVPGIFVYEMIFRAQRYNLGAAAAIVMLVSVALVIVPYLARQLKSL